MEELSKISVIDRDINYENRLDTIFQFLVKYRNMSVQDWEIRRRWFRRYMNKIE